MDNIKIRSILDIVIGMVLGERYSEAQFLDMTYECATGRDKLHFLCQIGVLGTTFNLNSSRVVYYKRRDPSSDELQDAKTSFYRLFHYNPPNGG